MTEFSSLPPELRARAYLGLADQARRDAVGCKGAMRDSYLLIASQWERLAAEAAATVSMAATKPKQTTEP